MTASEKDRLLSSISLHREDQLRFLIEACSINSYSYNKTGTDTVAELVLSQIANIFPSHTVVRQNDVGDHHHLSMHDAPRSIYLLGHLDTVFPPDHPFQECRLVGDWLIGPGTADMKGGIAVLVYSLKALHETGLLERLRMSVILSGDEEIGSVSTRTLYEAECPKAAACLVFECGGRNGEIVLSRNGKAGARLACRGRDRHVGDGTHEKTSAILEISHKVIALEALNAVFPGVSLNVGRVAGGLGPATIPAHAEALFDIRWKEQEHYESLLQRIEAIVRDPIQLGSSCDVRVLNYRPAMPRTDGTEAMGQRLCQTSEFLGRRLDVEHRRGTSDANFFGSAGVPTLDGLGPIGEHDHTTRERIRVSSLTERTALVALFLAEHGGHLCETRLA